MVSQGVRPTRCIKLGISVLVVTPQLIYYFTVGLTIFLLSSGIVKVTVRDLKSKDHCSSVQKIRDRYALSLCPLPYPRNMLLKHGP